MTDYTELNREMAALSEGSEHMITVLANAAALIYHRLEDINWAGFYVLEEDVLFLGPFQGKPACTKIKTGKGVCGTAVAENRTVRVENVHCFKGHIACDSASRSEIVVPLRNRNGIIGVLDIDSPSENRFSQEDEIGIETVAKTIENALSKTKCTKIGTEAD